MSGKQAKRSPATTASYSVNSPKRGLKAPAVEQSEAARPSRLALQLAMAHKIDGMIRRGEIRNMAEAARLAGVTRARITQIANLTLLAPNVQQEILSRSGDSVSEHHARGLASQPDWSPQRRGWRRHRGLGA